MSYNKLKNIIHTNILIDNIYNDCEYIAPLITVFNPEKSLDYCYNNIKIEYTNTLIASLIYYKRLDEFVNDIDNLSDDIYLDEDHILININNNIDLDDISKDIHNNINYTDFKQLIINKYIDEHYFAIRNNYNDLIIKNYISECDDSSIKNISTIAVIYEYILNNNSSVLFNETYKIENYLESKYNREYRFEDMDMDDIDKVERYIIKLNKNNFKDYVTDDMIKDIIKKYYN